MYTKQYDDEAGNWYIADSDGDAIIPAVLNEDEADTLLSHLNR